MSTMFKLTLFGASFLFSAGRFVRVKVGNNVEWQELDRVDAHQGKLISSNVTLTLWRINF